MSPENSTNDDSPAEPTVESSAARSADVSDVVLVDSETGAAPSFRAPASPGATPRSTPAASGPDAPTAPMPPRDRPTHRPQAPLAMLPGARVDDFEIIRMLGRGAFGHVYLARQISLDRQVALKVSANRGSEGRTMARLEHQHIVQVFSEIVEPEFNQRLLCMQLVPGIGLEKLIAALHENRPNAAGDSPPAWTGDELLAIIDRSASLPAALDPSALHDREALARMDAVEATAWFGARLAEALDFAHRHGVLHRDIKPANILVNPYGRPMLADFNISSQPIGSESGGEEMFGGTFAYMAPEHLDAFNPAEKQVGPDAVTAQSDLFSLGLVLQQMLTGRIEFVLPARKDNMIAVMHDMAADRRKPRPDCSPSAPSARQSLERTIHRCLAPRPEDRFASGAELAAQLDGCRRLRAAERQLPRPPAPLKPVLGRPFLWLILLVVLPQIVASAVNITYNFTQIVGELSEPQKSVFTRLVIGYNAVMYPAALVLFVLAVRPVWRCWRALSRADPVTEAQVTAARQRALKLPLWIAALTAWGWFPGGFLFPLVIAAAAPPLSAVVGAHFVMSFFLSGLIALAYSLCGAQFVVLRALYPAMWVNTRGVGESIRTELAPVGWQLGAIQILAVMIPLVAGLLLLVFGGEANATFRGLVAGLIVLGILGLIVANAVTRGLYAVVSALTKT